MFIKKVLLLTTTLLIYTGCGENGLGVCQDYDLQINIPDFEMDDNNYYHINDSVETITLKADIGNTGISQHIGWATNEYNLIDGYWEDFIDNHSFSNEEDGLSYTTLYIGEGLEYFISDTITITCGFEDDCWIVYRDTLRIVID